MIVIKKIYLFGLIVGIVSSFTLMACKKNNNGSPEYYMKASISNGTNYNSTAATVAHEDAYGNLSITSTYASSSIGLDCHPYNGSGTYTISDTSESAATYIQGSLNNVITAVHGQIIITN